MAASVLGTNAPTSRASVSVAVIRSSVVSAPVRTSKLARRSVSGASAPCASSNTIRRWDAGIARVYRGPDRAWFGPGHAAAYAHVVNAIIFDFDGTLVDTEPIHEEALSRAARRHGASVAPGSSIGLADEDALAGAFGASGVRFDDALIREACAEKTCAYLDLIGDAEITVYEGAVELVRAAAASGPTGICTAAMRAEVEPVLLQIGLGGVVPVVVCADDVEAKKPDPAGYLDAAARLGLDPGACVVVEDSERGVEAGVRAGAHVVAVGHTTDRARLRRAHAWVERIGELDAGALRGALIRG